MRSFLRTFHELGTRKFVAIALFWQRFEGRVPMAYGDVEESATPSKGNYELTRFNAVKHGVLSKHTVLPWEDFAEYARLVEGLVEEHAPKGPTEEHLIEELAGIMWRKRRLRLARKIHHAT
jgi:hypothetical protein